MKGRRQLMIEAVQKEYDEERLAIWEEWKDGDTILTAKRNDALHQAWKVFTADHERMMSLGGIESDKRFLSTEKNKGD